MGLVSQYPTRIEPITVTVAASGTESTEAILLGTTAAAICTPAALTSTSITFEGSCDNGATFQEIRDPSTGSAISATVAADGIYPLNPHDFFGVSHLKIICGSAEAAERIFTIMPYSI